MQDVTPGTDSVALTVMTPSTTALPLPPPSLGVELARSAWGRGALVALVFVLGLLQGTRAALGDIPLAEAPAAAEAPAEPPAGVTEPDALRGHFFRPAGSDAVRPSLRLQQGRWSPGEPEEERLALACEDAAC
jgi:hypothetical protein